MNKFAILFILYTLGSCSPGSNPRSKHEKRLIATKISLGGPDSKASRMALALLEKDLDSPVLATLICQYSDKLPSLTFLVRVASMEQFVGSLCVKSMDGKVEEILLKSDPIAILEYQGESVPACMTSLSFTKANKDAFELTRKFINPEVEIYLKAKNGEVCRTLPRGQMCLIVQNPGLRKAN